mgnify:FL=1
MKNLSKYNEVLSEAAEGVIICAFLAPSVIYIDDVKTAVIKAVKSCAFTIVPSLFVMCVLSSAIMSSRAVKKALSVFRINSSILTAFILGNIGGYPIGTKILKDMVDKKELTAQEAEKAVCFCYASGPAFCLGIISASVFKSRILGLASVGTVFLANLCLFLFYAKSFSRRSGQTDMSKRSFTDVITSSVTSSSYAMLSVCSAIVFFSAIIAIINAILPATGDMHILNSILEISNAASLKCAGLADFVIITVLLAFGGICVHMQIKSLAGSAFSFKRFYLTMPAKLALTAAFAGLFYYLIQRYLPASSEETNIILSQSGSIVPLICVIGMSAISFTYRYQKSKRAG